ncbi:sulfotransferase [Myxococcota bacterium]|nr:sulfotransferase [Myxococcota bacterium]
MSERRPAPPRSALMDWTLLGRHLTDLWAQAREGRWRSVRHSLQRGSEVYSIVGWTLLGRAADHLLFPGFRRQQIQAPVLVIAPPRSGTTLLFNLLEQDPAFVAAPLYGTILPSLTLQRLIHAVAALDARLGGRGRRALGAWQDRSFGVTDHVHRVRFNEVEEDTFHFGAQLADIGSTYVFPNLHRVPDQPMLDDRPQHVQDKVMAFYEGSVRRALYDAPGRRYLAKNVYSGSRVALLNRRFPDAQFVHIARHPAQVIASAANLLYSLTHSRGDETIKPRPPHPLWRAIAFHFVEVYRRVVAFEAKADPRRFKTVRYDALTRDPHTTVNELYDHFGWPRDAAHEARLTQAMSERATLRLHDRKRNHYRLADFGITEAELEAAMPEVYERYGFVRREPEGSG